MIKINDMKYKIEEQDRKIALKEKFNANSYFGYLGEIAFAKCLNMEWENPGYKDTDLIAKDGIKYQVKTHVDSSEKKRFWLDGRHKVFDYYVFCHIDKNEQHVYIDGMIEKEMVEANSHSFLNKNAIYRRR